MERKWTVRDYREGDEEGILDLWKVVYPSRDFDRERWLRWWRWMYKENPAAGGKVWACFADHDGRIVGQYAINPVRMKISGKTIIGAQSLDTMTHPAYTRQGIFETLAKQVYKEAAAGGIPLVYGFPNKLSYPGFVKKLDWFSVAPRQIVFKPLNWRNAVRLRVSNKIMAGLGVLGGRLVYKLFDRSEKVPVIDGLTLKQVSTFDERINELWSKVSDRQAIAVVRDREYLNWRYCSVPDVKYSVYLAEKAGEVQGYIVFRCVDEGNVKTGIIFDVISTSPQISRCLIAKAMEDCRESKVDIIYGLMIADKMLILAFKATGLISIPFVKDGWLGGYSSSPDLSKDFLGNRHNWLVQIGDSDKI